MENTEPKAKKLTEEVSKKYDLQHIAPGSYDFQQPFGVIDLCKIDLEKADQLVANGFKFLVLKEAPAENKTPATKASAVAAKNA